jgi:hypothetical protein
LSSQSSIVEVILHALKHHPTLEELHLKVTRLPRKPDHRAMSRLIVKLPGLRKLSFEMISDDIDDWSSYRASLTSVLHRLSLCCKLEDLSISHLSKLGNSFVTQLLKALQAPFPQEFGGERVDDDIDGFVEGHESREGNTEMHSSMRSSVSTLRLSQMSISQWTTVCSRLSKNNSNITHLNGILHETWRSSGGRNLTTSNTSADDFATDDDTCCVSIGSSDGVQSTDSSNMYESATALRNLLSLNSALLTLHVTNQKLKNYGGFIAEGLVANAHLRDLQFTQCELSLSDVRSISYTIHDTNRSLTSFGINLTPTAGGKQSSDEQDVRCFLMAIANQGRITKLRIEGTAGMATIAQSLSANLLPAVSELQLDCSTPRTSDCAAVVKSLETNTTLEVLIMPDTSIKSVAESLPRIKRLRRLHLTEDFCVERRQSVLPELAASLERNSSLLALRIDSEDSFERDEEVWGEVRRLLHRNRLHRNHFASVEEDETHNP